MASSDMRARRARNLDKSLPPHVVTIAVGFLSFFAGTLCTMYSGITQCSSSPPSFQKNDVEEIVRQRILEFKHSQPDCKENKGGGIRQKADDHGASSKFEFPDSMSRFAVGMSRVDKLDFAKEMDLGVPLDLPTGRGGDSEVIVLYGSHETLPNNYQDSSTPFPLLPMKDAVERCDYVNVVLTDRTKSRNQCIAVVPQYESYHIQKWMRLKDGKGKVDTTQKLHMVSRGMQSNGANQFAPPGEKHISQNWELLSKYFASYEDALADLKVVLDDMKPKDNTVIVMVSNYGQSELLVNFVCAANRRNLDTSQILVFATDVDTKRLAESLGLRAFYDERNFGAMPSEAAGHYGDHKFTAMMMAKVICVQMVSALHYDLLFQDVDIVWYKDPLEYFQSPDKMGNSDFDMFFQDDGGHSVRYAPYSANSGFYYVRHNARTQYFLTSLLMAGDLILKTDSHQQALIALMSEHVSLYGLKTKVISRDTPEFPGGYHFHQASGAFMKSFFNKEVEPYLFHMSWTLNKDNKLLFFQQMGDWYVQEQCVHKKVEDVAIAAGSNFISTCCSAEPLIACHYRDKPSKFPCKDSPPIDKGHSSWW